MGSSKLEDHLEEMGEEIEYEGEFEPKLEKEGIEKELERFQELEAYEPVDKNQLDLRERMFITTRWVKVKKLDEDGKPS